MAFLDATDLRLTYGAGPEAVTAVDGVSFRIDEPGTCLGVIGETGSGKTSLLYALTRVFPPSVSSCTGEVILNGTSLMEMRSELFRREIRWKRIAIVFQASMNGFNPVQRIGRQIGERALLEPDANPSAVQAKVRGLLKAVGLREETEDRFPHELSGGMKQRAAIAMSLVMDPELLILDEPTSALDVSVQAQIMNTLKKLKWEREIAMIFITHDIALASDLSDSLAVMKAGTIREQGAMKEILQNPKDEYTRTLLASTPSLLLSGGVEGLHA